jgi:hypothetical protein
MTEATLLFVREEAAPEETRLIDHKALVGNLCDVWWHGKDVTFSSGQDTVWLSRSGMSVPSAIWSTTLWPTGSAPLLTVAAEARTSLLTTTAGIAASVMEQVFEPFGGWRRPAATFRRCRTRYSHCALIVRRHGGDITLANRPDEVCVSPCAAKGGQQKYLTVCSGLFFR